MGAYAVALVLTLAIEVPIYGVAFARRSGWRAAVGVGVLANVVSHPLAFLVALPLLERVLSDTAALAVTEIGVLLLEAAVVSRRSGDGLSALTVSAVANATSFAVGALLVA